MTWLSRFIPNGRRSLQRATKRRRRMMSLEALEGRTLLSNVVVTFNAPTSSLLITGNSPTDNSNQNFTITENTAPGPLFGTVTVAPGATRVVLGVGVVPGSTIDGSSTPFTTGSTVTSIAVALPGHHQLRLRHPDRRGQDHTDDRRERHRQCDRGQSDFRRE